MYITNHYQFQTFTYIGSLENIGNPFAGLPSLEQNSNNGSLENVGNPFAGLPSLEQNSNHGSLENVGNPFAGKPSLEPKGDDKSSNILKPILKCSYYSKNDSERVTKVRKIGSLKISIQNQKSINEDFRKTLTIDQTVKNNEEIVSEPLKPNSRSKRKYTEMSKSPQNSITW